MDPQLIYAVPLAVGLVLHHWHPVQIVPSPVAAPVGVAALILGLMVGFSAVVRFRRARTSLQPWEPTTALVTDGPYRFTRNPIYLGYMLLYVGVALWRNSLWPFVLLPLLLPAMHRGVIVREEAYLEGRFGDSYRAYKERVRRWL